MSDAAGLGSAGSSDAAELAARLRQAVAERREKLVDLTAALVRERSLIGAEESAQRILAERLRALGFAVERVAVEPPADERDPTWGYAPASYDGRTCVAGRIGAGSGRSLHLSGHIDVVPVETPGDWRHDPWGGEIAEGRVWGRGAGDMKGGLAAYLIAVEAFLQTCGQPSGELLFSSVIEEECTGNGMKAVLAAGYDGDATLIGEPSGLALWNAGVGVIWVRLRAASAGAHVAYSSGEASSARLLDALTALRELELRLNERGGGGDPDEVFLAAHERPFRVNIGTLSGGAWPSSEPAEAQARVRVGFGLKLTPAAAQILVREAVAAAAPEVEVSFEGFRAPAYCDDLDHELAHSLIQAHTEIHATAPRREALPGTTDARSVVGPCVCYGPLAGAIHATDEWVDIDSLEAVAAAVALTIAAWQCPAD